MPEYRCVRYTLLGEPTGDVTDGVATPCTVLDPKACGIAPMLDRIGTPKGEKLECRHTLIRLKSGGLICSGLVITDMKNVVSRKLTATEEHAQFGVVGTHPNRRPGRK